LTARYRFSSAAESDLAGILRCIADRDGVARALGVHTKFVEAFESLAEMPSMGSLRRSLTGDRTRWHVVFRWIVLYDSESDPIIVLRVILGARDLDRLVRPDGIPE